MNQPLWLAEAWAEFGQRERAGAASNDRVLALYRDAGHDEVRGDEVPCCAAFVGACLKRTISTTSPSVLYTSAQQIADFGAPQSQVSVKVYQLGAVYGRGTPRSAVL